MKRLDVVQYLVEKNTFREEISGLIRQVGDLERLLSKVAVNRINPREVNQLKRALRAIEPLRSMCIQSGCQPLVICGDQLNPCKTLADRIEHDLNNDPPVQINRGNVVAEGVSEELDELRKILYKGRIILMIFRPQPADWNCSLK